MVQLGVKMQSQLELLKEMEQDFKITRKIFLNLKTGWFDNSKGKSNMVSAKDITLEPVQGRYRLNLTDNLLRVQEFFFDIEWSQFDENGAKIKLITKEITNQYFPKLKRAAKRLLFPLLKYIPKEFIYIRVSGTGLHIIFFVQGLQNMDEFMLITKYFIFKSKLKNTKHVDKLIFGLDTETMLSSDRKIAEFGSWNKLKKDFKEEVDYLNYATYLSVDDFFKAKHYPFCPDFESVKYPSKYQCIELPKELLQDAKNAKIDDFDLSDSKDNVAVTKNPVTEISLTPTQSNIKEFKGEILKDDPAYQLVKSCKCYWNMLRDENAPWYSRQFLVKFLKYALRLNREQILELIHKYNGWSDYNPRITAFYVNKHFRKGTCETKVMKPPRKKTLIKYGLCDNQCTKCVYRLTL